MPVDVSLPDHLRPVLDEQVVSGRFASHSAYIETLVRQEQERMAQARHEETAKLEAMLLARMESGEPVEMARQDWSDLRAELVERITAGKAK